MLKTFSAMGLEFLYPDNWVVQAESESENHPGVMLDLPSGGFFTLEPVESDQSIEVLVDQIAETFKDEYGEVEAEQLQLNAVDLPGVQLAVDYRFYYLDLLIISRLMFSKISGLTYAIQFQSESRDFEKNELVINAILKQIESI